MKNRILGLVFVVFVTIIIPLYPRSHLLAHPFIITFFIGLAILIIGQPEVPIQSIVEKHRHDQGSMQIIILVMILSLSYTVHVWQINFKSSDVIKVKYLYIILIIIGLYLRQWAIGTLGKHFCPIVTVSNEQKLIVSGPYRYIRHPSYSGSILFFGGYYSMFGNLRLQILLTTAIVLCYLYRIHVEEKALKTKFGSEFETYCQNSYCLIPFVY